MEENWRDVPGYEGLYQISIDTKKGKCRSLNYNRSGKVKELSNRPDRRGRINWVLFKDKKSHTKQAAKWIALTYPELVENDYFESAEIDHKDTDTLNNYPSNLHWVTRSGNQSNPLTKEHLRTSKINRSDQSKRVLQYTLDGKYVNDYPSASEAERQTGYTRSGISNTAAGRLTHYKGYKWKYLITK